MTKDLNVLRAGKPHIYDVKTIYFDPVFGYWLHSSSCEPRPWPTSAGLLQQGRKSSVIKRTKRDRSEIATKVECPNVSGKISLPLQPSQIPHLRNSSQASCRVGGGSGRVERYSSQESQPSRSPCLQGQKNAPI
ncbi:hypothetical protein EV421DRAFT_1731621 [Armillaria borealis]|uniref:Uncharacterized protein n=1 Tax=Armillaria borealis TaxID=47425 RepID=A0AA39MH86_9AGAR|nr:hypothetical protein EV421DRAFT_1741458 [Armillaria borealis]KAK0437577.1 hypothetical protein EV421DRAFT_1739027 [Armillaria borealis]KAK0451836.1 hypothetical protein EV421DRAFT_1731621 [Armillaria borealis]